jgi:DNA mismatch endonuclease (patch repair protein)
VWTDHHPHPQKTRYSFSNRSTVLAVLIDKVSKEQRSSMMRAVRSKDTAPEMLVRRAAHRLGLRFRLHCKSLPGRPDLSLKKWRTVIFVNGCFWHRHAGCRRASVPQSNKVFWLKKLKENVRRDQANYAQLKLLGWHVIVLWQCEVKTPEQATVMIKQHFRTLFAKS